MTGEIAKLDRAFEALANPKRRGMINALAYHPATVSQLAKEFDLSLPAMHKHTNLLERAEFIKRRKVGRVNFVALNYKTLRQIQAWINQYHAYGSDEETLENYIASLKDSDITRKARDVN